MGFVNAGIDGTAFPSPPRPLRAPGGRSSEASGSLVSPRSGVVRRRRMGRRVPRCVSTWKWGCSGFPGVLCALHLGETRPESKGRGRNAGIYLSRRTLRAARATRIWEPFETTELRAAKPVWWRQPCTQEQEQGHRERQLEPEQHIPPGHNIPNPSLGALGIPRNPPQHREQPHSGIWAEQRSETWVRGRISSVPGVNQRKKSKMLLSQSEKLGVLLLRLFRAWIYGVALMGWLVFPHGTHERGVLGMSVQTLPQIRGHF